MFTFTTISMVLALAVGPAATSAGDIQPAGIATLNESAGVADDGDRSLAGAEEGIAAGEILEVPEGTPMIEWPPRDLRDLRACTVVYNNMNWSGRHQYLAFGTTLLMADDAVLAGTNRGVTEIQLMTYKPPGTAYNITVSVYNECPPSCGGEGTRLLAPRTQTGIPAGAAVTLTFPVACFNATETVWIEVSSNQSTAGWFIHGNTTDPGDVGTTLQTYGSSHCPYPRLWPEAQPRCDCSLDGGLYAGFAARLCAFASCVPGACCDNSTGHCVDNALADTCTNATQRFILATLCSAIEPLCGKGACCLPATDANCDDPLDSCCQLLYNTTTNGQCTAASGTWHGGEVCTLSPTAVTGIHCPPHHDNCTLADTQVFTGTPLTYNGRNDAATDTDCQALEPAGWIAFTTSECLDIVLDFCGTDPSFLSVYSLLYPACCDITHGRFADFVTFSSREGHCCKDDPPGWDINATIKFYDLPTGTWYYPVYSSVQENASGYYTITVDGTPCGRGRFEDRNRHGVPDAENMTASLRDVDQVDFAAFQRTFDFSAPPSDSCAGAPLIPCNTNATFNNSAATDDSNDPVLSCVRAFGTKGSHTMWYKFVAAAASVRVQTCNNNDPTASDTVIALYSGTCGGLTELACGEDGCGGQPPFLLSEICYGPLNVGQTYYIEVATSTGGTPGEIRLDIECPCPDWPLPITYCYESCPPGGHAESEPNCYNEYRDWYNSGCNARTCTTGADCQNGVCVAGICTGVDPLNPPVVDLLDINEQVWCGKSGRFTVAAANRRDTDWYEITVCEWYDMTWSVYAQFPQSSGLVETDPVGSADCNDGTGYINPGDTLSTAGCLETSITANAGIYRWYVAPSSTSGPVACAGPNNEYFATLWMERGSTIPTPADDCAMTTGGTHDIPAGGGTWSGKLSPSCGWTWSGDPGGCVPGETGCEGPFCPSPCGWWDTWPGEVDVWWRYVAPCTGRVTFQTCGYDVLGNATQPTEVATILAVWEGNCNDFTTPAHLPTACGGGIDIFNNVCGGPPPVKPKIMTLLDYVTPFEVTQGNTYYIQLMTESSTNQYGIVTLDVSECVTPCGPPQGACCIAAPPYCFVDIEPNCTGIYLGDGTICDTHDCNGNDVPDTCDIARGISRDCNSNSIPDECDIAEGTSKNCNSNGIPDDCDIAEGTSKNCNSNGTPDECEADCNTNLIPDECDIAGGTSQDYNTNGVPDECEDCNSNGTLDDCDVVICHDCCETGHGSGCSDPGIESCVCADDHYCCETEWDRTCVAKVTSLECGSCVPYSKDCNGNGTPDECEPDCNSNEVPDDCDVDPNDPDGNGQISPDCEGPPTQPNGIPDECDIAEGTSKDCNSNGIPDECDIAEETSKDCEGPPSQPNGIPDECDIAEGTSKDCNSNGVPDECEEPIVPRFLGTADSVGSRCSLLLHSGESEPRNGRIWKLVFHFDCPPPDVDPILKWDDSCPPPPHFDPYSGPSVMNCEPLGKDLACTFTGVPFLQDRATYQFDLSPITGDPTDLFVISGLVGDPSDDKRVSGADVSYINARWGTADCRADVNESGIVGGADVSVVNANWGNCAP